MKYLMILFLLLSGCASMSEYKEGCIDGIIQEQGFSEFIKEDDDQGFKDFMRKNADRRCTELEAKRNKALLRENSTYRRPPYQAK